MNDKRKERQRPSIELLRTEYRLNSIGASLITFEKPKVEPR